MCNFCARIWGPLRPSLLLRKPRPSPCRLTLLYISTLDSTQLAWCMDWKRYETFNKNDQLIVDLGLLVVNLITCLQYFRFCIAQWLSIIFNLMGANFPKYPKLNLWSVSFPWVFRGALSFPVSLAHFMLASPQMRMCQGRDSKLKDDNQGLEVQGNSWC